MIKFSQLPENILELLPGAEAYLEAHPKTLFSDFRIPTSEFN
jgi:hypothetical protein